MENTKKPGVLFETPAKTGGSSLFDASKLNQPIRPAGAASTIGALATMTLAELLELRAAVDSHLPARSLSELDLEEEVLLQFARTKGLYDDVIKDDKTPANQRAQVANSCTAILDQLIKMQKALYSAERVKAIEGALIRTLKEFPEAQQTRFFELYERALSNIAAPGAK
jgi:hypothetical protein